MSTMYLVVRRAVLENGEGCFDQGGPDTGSRVPLRLFASRGAAERLVAELTAEARRTMNPFALNGSEVPDAVRDFLSTLKLSAKCPKEKWSDGWRAWWDRCADEMTAEQLATAWAAFGTLQPYEVLQVECE
jgi:hypothetical protein